MWVWALKVGRPRNERHIREIKVNVSESEARDFKDGGAAETQTQTLLILFLTWQTERTEAQSIRAIQKEIHTSWHTLPSIPAHQWIGLMSV